jgi:carboxylesterase type B
MKTTPVLFVALSALTTTYATDRSTTVNLGYSTYEGVQSNSGVTRFSGIRYAAAPLGDLRFRAAQDPVSTGNQSIAANVVSFHSSTLSYMC